MNNSPQTKDQPKTINIAKRILSENDRLADQNRSLFAGEKVCVLNLISSPGSGKTSLLVETIRSLKEHYRVAVIEGDQQTDCDSRRILATGVPAIQINTGQACHLDAGMVGKVLGEALISRPQLLFIENVGNLICPAEYDLGETAKVVLMSVTEGEEKPLKYPLIFHLADVLVLTKIDLLPYLPFDLDLCLANAQRIHPNQTILNTSALHPETNRAWLDWLCSMVEKTQKNGGHHE